MRMILAEGRPQEPDRLPAGTPQPEAPQIGSAPAPVAEAIADALAPHQVRSCDRLRRWICSCGAGGQVGRGGSPARAAALHQAEAILARLGAP